MKTDLALGATIDTLDKGELRQELATQTQEAYAQLARGVKYLRFGPVATTVANSAFTFDGSQAGNLGPREGFVWTIRRLLVTGLGTGTTPDVINFYRGPASGIPLWQLNGNSFGATFGKCELLLLPGEYLSFASSGTIAATGQITVSGDLVEAAAEEIFKLI